MRARAKGVQVWTRSSALLAVLAALSSASPAPAQGSTDTVADGDDVAGPLDVRSVSHGHRGARLTHTLRTYGAFPGRLLAGDNAVVFAFDTNNRRSSFERGAVVFWANGRLRAVVVNRRGNLLARVAVSRPDRRSVKVTLSRRALGSPDGYRWLAVAVAGSRADFAPNRRLILHDVTAPEIVFKPQPVPADTTYDVTFGVSDSGGAGLRRWRLEQRPLGATQWSTIVSGRTLGTKTVSVTAAQGDDDEYRVVAVDRQGNTRTSAIRTVSVPIDDTDPAVAYSPPSSGWTSIGAPAAFLGTVHTTATIGDTVTYAFEGSYFALVGPRTCGAGTVSVDGVTREVRLGCGGGQRRILFAESFPASANHTVSFTLTDGSFSLDGIITRGGA